ncbi:MAG: Hpt domain-containing protein [Chlamydiia bacterium]|nr:Hpt domain-containing protein [Chlamydiia bacterium]
MEEIPADLKELYKEKIPGKIETIRGLLNAYGIDPTETAYKALYIEIHKFAGSAGTYGYPELSKILRTMEETLKLELPQKKLDELKRSLDQLQESFLRHE